MWVKSLVVEGREGRRILLSSLRSMEMVSQSEGRWFDDLWPCLKESWMGMVESHDVQVVGQPLLAVLLLPHHLQGGLHGREQGDQVRRKVRMLE